MICQNDDFCVASCCAGFSRKVHSSCDILISASKSKHKGEVLLDTTTISGKNNHIHLGTVLIIAVLSIIAIFSSAIMRLLGFEYESVGGFILYFIIASIVSYPMN